MFRIPARAVDVLATCAPPLAAGVAFLSLARWSAQPDAEAAYLALPVAAVLLAAAVVGRRGVAATAAALAALAGWVLPPGPERGAAVFALLAVTLAAAAWDGLARRGRPAGRRRLPWGRTVPLALGIALLAGSGHLWGLGWNRETLLRFLLLPLVAAAAATLAAGRWRGRRAARPVLRPVWVAGALGVVVVTAATLASAYPWLSRQPFAAVGRAARLAMAGAPVAAAPAVPATLTAADPSWQLKLPGEPVSGVVLDTHLAYGAGLPAGTPVATVRLLAGQPDAAPVASWPLVAGIDTAEWAASRPEVAARLAAPPPDSWLSWVPPGGGYFGHVYRSRQCLAAPAPAVLLVVERHAELPEEVRLVLSRVELR